MRIVRPADAGRPGGRHRCGEAPRVLAGLLACAAAGMACGEAEPPGPAREPGRAATPAARANDRARPPQTRRRTLEQAVAEVARRTDVPVLLPHRLPPGTEPVGLGGGRSSAYLTLRLPGRRTLSVQYGGAGFDGCPPRRPRAVRVGSRPGAMLTTGRSRRRHTTLIWPATPDRPRGRYGLSGDLPPARVRALAESMGPVRAPLPRGSSSGC